MTTTGEARCTCGHAYRLHMGAGTCLAAAPGGEASVCPCLTFTPTGTLPGLVGPDTSDAHRPTLPALARQADAAHRRVTQAQLVRCSRCRRKLRDGGPSPVPGGRRWVNHAKDCPRLYQAPDAP